MKKIRLLAFMLVLVTGFCATLSAQTDSSSNWVNTQLKETTSDNTKKPRSIVSDRIDCSYCNGILSLSSSSQIFINEVVIVDENDAELIYCINDVEATIPITLNQGVWLIRCVADDEREYEGYLSVIF